MPLLNLLCENWTAIRYSLKLPKGHRCSVVRVRTLDHPTCPTTRSKPISTLRRNVDNKLTLELSRNVTRSCSMATVKCCISSPGNQKLDGQSRCRSPGKLIPG